MLEHRGFRAWITSEGRKVTIYEPRVEHDKNVVTCWIPAVAGKNFAVNWEDIGTGVDSAAYITLDGFKVPGRYLFGKGIAWRTGVRAGPTLERPFTFSDVDGGAAPEKRGDVRTDHFGMIVLRIRQIIRSDDHQPNPVRLLPNSMRGENRFSLCVKLGPEVPCTEQPASTWTISPYDKKNPGSYVTFIFRYRSPDFLDAQGLRPTIAPSSDVTSSSASSRKSGKRKSTNDQQVQRASASTSLSSSVGSLNKRQRSSPTSMEALTGSQIMPEGSSQTSFVALMNPPSRDSLEPASYMSNFANLMSVFEPGAPTPGPPVGSG